MFGLKIKSEARDRQDHLIDKYKSETSAAMIVDRAKTVNGHAGDPFHGKVVFGAPSHETEMSFGIHPAVGGYGDAPNPGDILCGALAACFDSTIRIIANRYGVKIRSLEVSVWAEVDVRGTLRVEKNVPTGFQSIKCNVDFQSSSKVPAKILKKIVKEAERSCVTMQTLLGNVSLETNIKK